MRGRRRDGGVSFSFNDGDWVATVASNGEI
jgi:hypothetical protein